MNASQLKDFGQFTRIIRLFLKVSSENTSTVQADARMSRCARDENGKLATQREHKHPNKLKVGVNHVIEKVSESFLTRYEFDLGGSICIVEF